MPVHKIMDFTGVEYGNLVALGFDGAVAMSGHLSGAQALFRADLHWVLYVHCFSHKLNLSLSHSCRVISFIIFMHMHCTVLVPLCN